MCLQDDQKCKICMEKIANTEPDEPLREVEDDSSDSNPYDDELDVSIPQTSCLH